MSVLGKIFSSGAKELTSSIGSVIDSLSTSEEEKLNAKNELVKIVIGKLSALASYQKEVLIAELSGSKLQRMWRPIVMLMFAFIVVYSKFVAPAFGFQNTQLEDNFWDLLKLGLGGYVVGRSMEKITDKVTQNIDLAFLKKKHRRNA